jgi:hypothetical protein
MQETTHLVMLWISYFMTVFLGVICLLAVVWQVTHLIGKAVWANLLGLYMQKHLREAVAEWRERHPLKAARLDRAKRMREAMDE